MFTLLGLLIRASELSWQRMGHALGGHCHYMHTCTHNAHTCTYTHTIPNVPALPYLECQFTILQGIATQSAG